MLESELIKEILKLGNGPHLFMSVLRKRLRRPSFYLSGIRLSRDEQFIYIADDQTVDELEGHLERSGINVGKQCDRGVINLWTCREWRQG